jgi:hypothetical protein
MLLPDDVGAAMILAAAAGADAATDDYWSSSATATVDGGAEGDSERDPLAAKTVRRQAR